jgi:DNA-binding transcriptional MocR family regulator
LGSVDTVAASIKMGIFARRFGCGIALRSHRRLWRQLRVHKITVGKTYGVLAGSPCPLQQLLSVGGGPARQPRFARAGR